MIDLSSKLPSAVFSDDGRFRYFLGWPTEVENDKVLLSIGANPSYAGQTLPNGTIRSDATISRLVNLARTLGYGWHWMVNVRAFIATDPKNVPPDPEAIGEHNDWWILNALLCADCVLCCYGQLGHDREEHVLKAIRWAGKVPHALALTKDGVPRHPRGVPSSARPFPYLQATP